MKEENNFIEWDTKRVITWYLDSITLTSGIEVDKD